MVPSPAIVGREDVAGAYRDVHAKDRLGEHVVGRGRSGPVHVGEFDDKIVDTLNLFHVTSTSFGVAFVVL